MTVESLTETVYFDTREGEDVIATTTATGPIDISLPSSGFTNPFVDINNKKTVMPGESSWESDVAMGRLYEEGAKAKEETKMKMHEHPNGSEGWLPTEESRGGVGESETLPRDYATVPNGNGADPHPQLVPVLAPPSVLKDPSPTRKDRHGEMMNYAPRSSHVHGEEEEEDEEEARTYSTSRVRPGFESQTTGGLAPMDSLSRRASVRSAFTSRTAGGGGFVPSLFESRKAAGGGAFAEGAATTAPSTIEPDISSSSSPHHDASLPSRKAKADGALTERQKSRVWKKEIGQGRRLSKVIREEAKTQSAALSIALTELEHTQRVQRKAVKEEGKQVEVHNRLVSEYQKSERVFLEAQERFEGMKGEVIAQERRLEMVRDGARDATLSLAMKAEEVERLRRTFAVDERERALRLKELKGVN